MSDELASLINSVRATTKAEQTIRRVREVIKAADELGLDVPTADLRIAIEGEEAS
jgi:hypothetical protein